MFGHGRMKGRNAQSTIEYILLVAGILAAFLIFLSSNGIFQNALNATFDTSINDMMNMSERILR